MYIFFVYYYHYLFVLDNLKYFDHFFTNSECTKSDLMKYANIGDDKITNIYGSVASKFNNLNTVEYSFNDRKNHIVYVSDNSSKKNTKGLIRAFAIAYKSNKIPKDSKLYLCYKLNKKSREELVEVIKESNVSEKEEYIRSHWLGRRTADCVGLIKGYGWYDSTSGTIKYGTNGMKDVTANGMYAAATEKGPISTMPDIPGLAVWHDGHIGIYIGNGYVIHAANTYDGVIKTPITSSGWTHWLKIPYINYIEEQEE